MFFIGGVNQGIRTLSYLKDILCPKCGKKARGDVYVIYWYFSFFFIPLFKWGKHYFVRMKCCHAVYEIDPVRGRALERGEDIDIDPDDLAFVGYMNGKTPIYGYGGMFGDEPDDAERHDYSRQPENSSCCADGACAAGRSDQDGQMSGAAGIAAGSSKEDGYGPAANTEEPAGHPDAARNADPAWNTDSENPAEEEKRFGKDNSEADGAQAKQSAIPDRIPRYCSTCGTELFEGMRICPKCGRKLNWYKN
ncbi:zinc ribbon domain-containing protein [[Clostridium] aminophilum]|uniref:Zinc-ribbon 15 domain-containing protein n=1 Tax=[Clostridium] aminophilum TaxID=1526 RepID=A0A1I6IY64_9FIRM|nr:zinc ribbon domain-containing protein [[Clostridium] aminophilum]SFR71657.1 hypothetical protein SAMN02910262_00976 [[Clostridium] aminophilum]